MWTIEYEADIASDLSAFHRIGDPMDIDGPRYFSLAVRLTAYAGVMAARAEKSRQDSEGVSGGADSASRSVSTEANPSRVSDDVVLSMLDSSWVEHVIEPKVVE